ncbi:MAG: hypothetical protein JKY98_06270 [Gammaproteobacteria bacterium]|nr:hypothetical protein [Gammaproteobacteria bacterium]
MKISKIEIKSHGNQIQISCFIENFELWIRVPSEYVPKQRGDPYIAALLLPAMQTGEPIELPSSYPVSPKLLRGITQLQQIYQCWFPHLKPVEIHAEVTTTDANRSGVASFFSGGVDGAYTLLSHQKEITHLVFAQGVDIQVDNQPLYQQALEKNEELAAELGKTLIPIQTNIRDWCHPKGLKWMAHYCGSGLAYMALHLGFPIHYIPASQPFDSLVPDGSHPLTDPLWSTESTELIYDGGIHRFEKIKKIATTWPNALNNLRVCWQDRGYNCGKCHKCLQTMLILEILDLQTPSFPRLDSLDPIRRLRSYHELEDHLIDDLVKLADNYKKSDIYDVLQQLRRREQWRRRLVHTDKKLFNGMLKSTYLKLDKFGND